VTGLEHQVAERLRELAALAAPAGGTTTADRAAALARTPRRRVLRWGTAVLALCLSAAVAGPTRRAADELTLRGRPTVAGMAARSAPEAYRLPPRGSLAADEDLLAGLTAREWSGGSPAQPPSHA